jgi:hypothetical protein
MMVTGSVTVEAALRFLQCYFARAIFAARLVLDQIFRMSRSESLKLQIASSNGVASEFEWDYVVQYPPVMAIGNMELSA